jgi:aspartate/methionine/tyrosine aminotransferase
MDYRRMPIEIESPEQLGYERIRCNLAESSVADAVLGDLGLELDLDQLVLQYGDHLGHAGLRAAIAADAWMRGAAHESSPASAASAASNGSSPATAAPHAGPSAGPLGPNDVLLTPGAAAALFLIATTLLGPGDHVVVARPNYATNLETPRAIGARIDHLDLRYEDGWRVDPEQIAAMLLPETRLVSLTSPHNPTGQVLDRAALGAIVEIVERHGRARLLLDETYRDMTYGGPLPPVASLSERAIGVSSLSKSDGLPGIRLGWLTSRDRALMDRLLAAKEQVLITGSVVDEAIGAEVIRRRSDRLPGIRAGIDRHLAIVRGWLAGQGTFEWVEPRGGVVGFPRVRPEMPFDEERFYATLFERHGTIVGPGHWFDQPRRYFRLGYGWPTTERLEEGLVALSAAAMVAVG